ncbi:hypothetical protein FGO68_gene2011 [Halteria grandinella]|uniref:Uncharacterized protein n=1 Tax=Halteria grandinella TaxID=5974 RepID=A0A8J8SVB3_HALGN|nr:hypothetical protein FGO68_gene2011 [Halteria grandinella]
MIIIFCYMMRASRNLPSILRRTLLLKVHLQGRELLETQPRRPQSMLDPPSLPVLPSSLLMQMEKRGYLLLSSKKSDFNKQFDNTLYI